MFEGMAQRLWLGVVRIIACAMFAIVFVAAPAVLRAEDGKIKVTVVAVLATSRHEDVDKRLKELAPELKKKDKTWTGFEFERSASESLKVGDKATFKLIDDFKVVIQVKEHDKVMGCVSLVITPDTLGEISYTCCCGKYFPVITRHDTKQHDRLVLVIMVKPCGK